MSQCHDETILVCARLWPDQWWLRKQYSILGTILCCSHCLHCCWYTYREKSDSIGSNVISCYFSPRNRKILGKFEPFMHKSFKNSKILWFRWTHARLFVIVPHQCRWMQYSSCCRLSDNIIWFYGTLWRCTMNDFKSLDQSEKSVIMRNEIENSAKLCWSSATICWPASWSLRYSPVMCWIHYSGMVTSTKFWPLRWSMIQIMMGAVINGNSTTIKGWSPFWYIIVLIQIFSFFHKFYEKFQHNFSRMWFKDDHIWISIFSPEQQVLEH